MGVITSVSAVAFTAVMKIYATAAVLFAALGGGSGDAPSTNSFVDGIVKWAASFGAGIIAVILIIAIIKEGLTYAKGNGGSLWSLVGKVLVLILMIGLIFLAQNYSKLGQSAQKVGEGALDVVTEQAEEAGIAGGDDTTGSGQV